VRATPPQPGAIIDSLHLLTINTGSSSLKAAVYTVGDQEQLLLTAQVERIGLPSSHLAITDAAGRLLLDRTEAFPDHAAALHLVLDWLAANTHDALNAVGHRVVHGGVRYSAPTIITHDLIGYLESLIPIDPNHLPQAIAAIEAIAHLHPDLPQIACFDTAFHRSIPRVAQLYALPRQYADEGIIRYGFHGLSYEYIAGELRRIDPDAARGRVIAAHLGNGASMAAIRAGVSLDTTMGFTPVGGLMMGTRCGDLDPGVLVYLLQERGMTPVQLNELINRQSGLLGVSGSSGDMHDLLTRAASDPHAAEAVELFCYQARKFIGSLTAVLGGLDSLIFTGGIGEHAAAIRAAIGDGLAHLGITIDEARNQRSEGLISADSSPVRVRVLKTNEDLMIARHTTRLLRETGGTLVRL
jgi:acetate kinase